MKTFAFAFGGGSIAMTPSIAIRPYSSSDIHPFLSVLNPEKRRNENGEHCKLGLFGYEPAVARLKIAELPIIGDFSFLRREVYFPAARAWWKKWLEPENRLQLETALELSERIQWEQGLASETILPLEIVYISKEQLAELPLIAGFAFYRGISCLLESIRCALGHLARGTLNIFEYAAGNRPFLNCHKWP